MAKITVRLCERGGRRAPGDTPPLPIHYMNEWSMLALRVSARRPALDLLLDQGVGISVTPAGTRLHFETLDQIPASIELLQQKGLDADLSDGVARVYQG
jgi:hypothetical protein